MKIFRKLFFLLCFTFSGNSLYSQDTTTYSKFNHTYFQEAGFSFYFSDYAFAPSLGYWFRFNFYEYNEFLSLSASCPLSIGGFYSSYYGGYFTLDLPATVDLNFGARANDLTEFPVGGFLGVGGAFNYMSGYGASRSYGPVIHTGLRTVLGRRPMTIRFSYLLGIGGLNPITSVDKNPNVLGFGLFYEI